MLFYLACACDTYGSISRSCDQNGKCTCKTGYTGDRCDGDCGDSYYPVVTESGNSTTTSCAGNILSSLFFYSTVNLKK